MAPSKGKVQQTKERKQAIFERRERVAMVREAGNRGVEAKDMPALEQEAKGRAAEQAGVPVESAKAGRSRRGKR